MSNEIERLRRENEELKRELEQLKQHQVVRADSCYPRRFHPFERVMVTDSGRVEAARLGDEWMRPSSPFRNPS